jgi:type VI secretion system protein ImpC
MRAPTIPYTILALAPLGGSGSGLTTVDLASLDEAVEELACAISIPVPKELCPAGALTFKPSRMGDFRPQGLVKCIPYLKELMDAAKFVEEAISARIPEREIAERLEARWPDLPVDFSAPAAASGESRQEGRVDDILSMVAMPGEESPGSPAGAKAEMGWKDQIERLLAGLLGRIFGNESFRKMEAAWRGVEILVKQGPVKAGEGLVVKLASIQDEGLSNLLEELEGQLVDEPPNLILLDHAFDNTPMSIGLLDELVGFAGDLLAPAAVWLGPSFFFLKGWNEVKRLPYLKHHLEDAAFSKWRKLREQPGSEWVAMAANRFLVRRSYNGDNPSGPVHFTEEAPLWISPVWALGTLIAQSVATFAWPTRFTDYRNLSLRNLAVEESEDGKALSTETVLSEDRILQLLDIGIMPLLGGVGKDTAFMPKETTLSGGSLKFQLFFNRLVGFLFKLKEEAEDAAPQGDIAVQLGSALKELFQRTGHTPPEDISIEAGKAEEGKSIPLKIGFTPPATILPADRLEFTFAW